MLNFFKRLFTKEHHIHSEQKAHFTQHGKYKQLKRAGWKVDVFEAPPQVKGEPNVHGYVVSKE